MSQSTTTLLKRLLLNLNLRAERVMGPRRYQEGSVALKVKVLVTQSCQTLCDPVGCSSAGSSAHGGVQAGIGGWVAMLSSRGSS